MGEKKEKTQGLFHKQKKERNREESTFTASVCVFGGWSGVGVNRLSSYLCSNRVERESQEAHKRKKAERKQSQVQDNDKVKCALNGSVQSVTDKAQPADKVCATQGDW